MSKLHEASEHQIQAARPDASTWLTANAGSGKTRVLTDRVARLLLDDVQPQHILCLTYTKAAASEMQNRLFSRLGEWAMLGDEALISALSDLGAENAIGTSGLSRARTLFARAIETPGGLKIQTIHSFCAALLRRFPLEAGVSPQFQEIEDRAASLLRRQVVEDMSDGDNAPLVDAIAQYINDTELDKLLDAIVRNRKNFPTDPDLAEIMVCLGLDPGFDEKTLESRVYLGGECDLITRLIAVLRTGGVTDDRAAENLAGLKECGHGDLPLLEGIFLTSRNSRVLPPFSAKIDRFPTKDLREANPDLMNELNPFMSRVEDARSDRLSLAAAHKALALQKFASVFLSEYESRKQVRGWLDFDDLIHRANELLSDPGVAAWVLYRLDGGIDHILVDEAQDTSPEQWEIIEKLTQEFTSGQGARDDTKRSIFVVGDQKQSIYSFQGADPAQFDRMKTEFSSRLKSARSKLESLSLEYSFRSSHAILRLVDTLFQSRSETGFASSTGHLAFKTELPGRVDLWPVVETVDETDDRVWSDPIDRPGPRHHNIVLADRIAEFIRNAIDSGQTIPVDDRKTGTVFRRTVHEGDFLILVQRRSGVFPEVIRACKAKGLNIAGADLLKVGAEIAVRDLAAVLSFLATPEDDLALATVLRSPLFGWSEQDLFRLAHGRGDKYLWQVLRQQVVEHPQTLEVLNDLRDSTDFLRPYDLIERLLTRHGGRRNLLARLGPEAEDGINALLYQALAYERSEIPSLTGFLVWMETDDLEVKRQMGAVRDQIRVMTVHGAKGLEAPIVILPDTADRKAPPDSEILNPGETPVWNTRAAETPPLIQAARDSAREKAMNERLRLLYVALTRAEKWLVVAGAGDMKSADGSWYRLVESALEQAHAEPVELPGGQGLRLSHGSWDEPPLKAPEEPAGSSETLPEWCARNAPAFSAAPKTLSPSELGGAKALPGETGLDEEAAMLRGTRIHRLLECLPEFPRSEWDNVATRILARVSETEYADLLGEARNVLTNDLLAPVFSGANLSEVSLTASVHGLRIHGTIDRLIIGEGVVRAIDFKTNAIVPSAPKACPQGLLRQMGAYAAALKEIYPDQRIETALLWTRNATLMDLPHELVTEALMQSPYLDAARRRS